MLKHLIAAVVLAAAMCSAQVVGPTTTYAEQVGPNTSASSGLSPINDTRAGIKTQEYTPAYGVNVSTLDIKPLVYPGFNGEVFAHVLPWFEKTGGCSSSRGGVGDWSVTRPTRGGHWCIGYDSYDPNQVKAQVDDLIRRGFDGVWILWGGVYDAGTSNERTAKKAVDAWKTELESRCVNGNCPLKMVLQSDCSALKADGANRSGLSSGSCSITTSTDENSTFSRILDDWCYLNKNYFGSPAYYKINNRPVWGYFPGEGGNTNASSPSWKDLWKNIRNESQNLATECATRWPGTYSGSADNGDLYLVFGTGASDLSHDGLTLGADFDGAFLWENLSGGNGVSNQDTQVANALSSAASYYSTAQGKTRTSNFGAAWAGFDDQLADWSPNNGSCSAGSYCTTSGRVVNRACGTTWINSLKKAGEYYSVSDQLPFLQLVTWNDYDEGTTLENGIDNCYRVTAFMDADGKSVDWNLTQTSSEASLQTVDHISIYATTNGVTFSTVYDGIAPAASGTKDLSDVLKSPGEYAIWVKMWGKNSIINRAVNAGTYTVADTPPPSGTPGPGTVIPPFPKHMGREGITVVGG